MVKWPGMREDNAHGAEAATAVRSVITCGLRLLSELGTFEVDTTMLLKSNKADKIVLRLHIGIGFGKVTSCDIGVPGTRLEYVISGPAVDDLKASTDATKPGDLRRTTNIVPCHRVAYSHKPEIRGTRNLADRMGGFSQSELGR